MKRASKDKTFPVQGVDKTPLRGLVGLSDFYRQAFEQSPSGAFATDIDGRILCANRKACELTGYSEAELIAMPPYTLIDPEEREAAADGVAAMLRGERPPMLRNRKFLHKDGAHAPIAASGGMARGADGKPTAIFIFLEDVAATRAAEDALRKSDERFQLAMRGINEGLFDWNIAEGTTYLSPRWKTMLGYDADDHELDASPEAWARILAPGMQEKLDERLTLIETGVSDTYEIELKLRHKSGRWVDVLSRAFPVFDGRGKMVRLVGTHQDITERKQRESELLRIAKVLESTHEGVAITDRDGLVKMANPAFERLTGYSRAETTGMSISALRSERDGPGFYRRLWATLEEREYWQGEVWTRRRDGSIFPSWLTISGVRDKSGALDSYVGIFSDISSLKQSEQRLDHIAHFDPLTDLPNRLSLIEQLRRTLARIRVDGRAGALLFLDLDRFKTINDSLGHAAGDELLKLASARWRNLLRPDDMLARVGGDEFVILMDPAPPRVDISVLAHELIRETAQPFVLTSGREVYVGLSIGVACFQGTEAGPDTLIQRADSALYAAKQAGGGVRYYSPDQTAAARARLETEAGLRRALERGEFDLQFQPQVRLSDGRATGGEALIRWRSPQGLVAPGEFIPLAEQTGLIIPIGDWVLLETCVRMKAWLDRGLDVASIAVNLSPRQFDLPDICERIHGALEASGLPPDRLEIEITESSLMQHGQSAVRKLETLKRLGVRIAIDDFGTGHSSLAYLKRFPIDTLKLDRAFIIDIPGDSKSMEIAAAVIRLGQSLHVDVLAEGVETKEQAEFLALAGCPTVQGFYFARPLWEGDWLALLERENAEALSLAG